MARQGYDDTDNISKVEALLLDEPGITRQAAIRRVVGANRSNIRRIETKMTRIAAEAPPPPKAAEPPRTAGPDARSEARCAAIAASAVMMAVGVWMLWPEAYVQAMLGLYWLQMKVAILVTGPLNATGAAMLVNIERLLAARGPAPLDAQALLAMRQDVSATCRVVLASAITATMVWSVWRIASLPGDLTSRLVANGEAPLPTRIGAALRDPRIALVAVVCIGGLGCTVPVMADLALVSVAILTFHCMGAPSRALESLDGRRP